MSNGPLYDVILFGTDLPDSERQEISKRLAALLDIPVSRAAALLAEPGTEIRRELTAEAAREWQKRLLAIGVLCNYRPTIHLEGGLRLATENDLTHSTHCPACGHEHETGPGVPIPLMCENCGVVFRKFQQVRLKKYERAKVRHEVMERERRKLAELEATARSQQEHEQRKYFEAQIRRELGLPRFFSNRIRLYASVLLLFSLGLTVGIVATLFVARAVQLCRHDWFYP